MTSVRSRCLVAGLLLALLASSIGSVALASDPDHNPEATKRSRKLYERGVALIKEGDQEAAIVAFEQAYEQKPLALFLYNIAQLHAWQARPQKALAYYERFMAESTPTAPERPEVEGKIRVLRAAMGTTRATPADPTTTVTPTSESTSTPSVAGPTISLTTEPPPAPAPTKKKRTGLWIALGVVGGVLVVGGVTTAVVLTTRGGSSVPGTDLGNVTFSQ